MKTSSGIAIQRPVIFAGLLFIASAAVSVFAHPLGNFSINRFARLAVEGEGIRIHYVVDMAEIPAFQELQAMDVDGDGAASPDELQAYAGRAAAQYASGLRLLADGVPVRLDVAGPEIGRPEGAGGLPTLRFECEYAAVLPGGGEAGRRVHFEDTNFVERPGWRELVVAPAAGISVFDSTAFGNSITDALNSYPQDLLAAPLDERAAEFSFVRGAMPAGARALMTREGRPAKVPRDGLAALVAVPDLTLGVAILGLLGAVGLGAVHALSPGHGKTVVGAYLVGARGTARHAAFLGLTVTVTHTAGVFALGLVTLFASRYVLPETLFPILSFASGATVLVIGLNLFVRRSRAAARRGRPHHLERNTHSHPHDHAREGEHSHGERAHTHLPPGADGESVTWRGLLALGISGGLLPCPSALVVMLAAISLGRIGYGLALVLAFSAGLAATLTAVGLAFVYAGRLFQPSVRFGGVIRFVPVLSAAVITAAGAAICYEALAQAGLSLGGALPAFSGGARSPVVSGGALSTVSVLALGFLLGLKHAVEADHIAAVTAIVSERNGLLGSTLVGGLWGMGHTAALLLAGAAALLFRIEIGEKTALVLEMGVALMLVALGANVLRKLCGGRLHAHAHRHGLLAHAHPHLHRGDEAPGARSHHGLKRGAKPVVVGMIHGLAGSAALMLLVLSTVPSPLAGMVYIAVFGAGSIGGMAMMSAALSLPLSLSARRFAMASRAARLAAGTFSLAFGLFMIYEIGFVEGLFR